MRAGSSISAVVLAAGSSTRMGTAKQLLRFAGRPLLQHALDNVRASGVSEVVLVLGYAAERIQHEISAEGVHVAINENYTRGMGTSLKTGLSVVDTRADGAVVVLADQPFVQPATIDRLIAEHRAVKAQIVIPTYRGFRGNPVLLDRSVFPEIMGLTGDVGCRAIFGDHLGGIVKLPVDDPGILLDIDRQQDFEALSGSVAFDRELVETADSHLPSAAETSTGLPELVIVGKDAVAVALARLGRVMRFAIMVLDPFLGISDLPEADRILHALDFSLLGTNTDRYVVVASRGACDEEAVEEALRAKSSYIGLVANKRRGEEVLRALRAKGIPPQALAQVRVPAGLNIDAESPEEIALSILAEITVQRRAAREHAP